MMIHGITNSPHIFDDLAPPDRAMISNDSIDDVAEPHLRKIGLLRSARDARSAPAEK